METQQTACLEAPESRALWLDRRSDRFQSHQQPLPEVRHSHRVWRDQHQARASGERFAKAHAGMDPERLGGERYLAHLLRLSGLWGQRCGDFQQAVSFARRDCKLESGEKNANDHERTNVRTRSGRTPA